MNSLYLSQKNLEEMINSKQYVITGVLETGEITLSVVSLNERDILDKLLSLESGSAVPSECEDKIISGLYKLSELHGNNSKELIKAWEQITINSRTDDRSKFDFSWKTVELCPKNGLQIKKFRDYG
jgi:hypothetical protein